MLSQVLDYIHNYFVKEVLRGTFKVSGGMLEIGGLLEGQYFMINGSVFNDGLHQYPDTGLSDETFDGEIWAMAIPLDVISIAQEVEAWVDKYGDVVSGPYTSESFGGYSYSKHSIAGSDGSGSVFDWRNVFKSRLNRWRKII